MSNVNTEVDVTADELIEALLARIEKLHRMVSELGVTYEVLPQGVRWERAVQKGLEASKPVVSIEGAITKKDGTVVPFSVTTKVEESK